MAEHHAGAHHHLFQVKGSPQGGYSLVIADNEFNYSDQLIVVVRALNGQEAAADAHFHVDGHTVGAHSLLDIYQGKTVKVTYTHKDKAHERVGSFEVPVLHASTPVHHQHS